MVKQGQFGQFLVVNETPDTRCMVLGGITNKPVSFQINNESDEQITPKSLDAWSDSSLKQTDL